MIILISSVKVNVMTTTGMGRAAASDQFPGPVTGTLQSILKLISIKDSLPLVY